MKKVSIFKTICWYVLALFIFGVLNEIAYKLVYSFLAFLAENIKLVRSFISYPILFQALSFFVTWGYGGICAAITFAILPKKSINVGKALFGCGTSWMIYGLVAIVLSIVGKNFFLGVSEIFGGLYLCGCGKDIENGRYETQIVEEEAF